jgi:hypothetical protein
VDETPTMALKRQIDSLQQDLQDHVEVLEYLRSVPESEALVIVRRLRTTPNVSTILSLVRDRANTINRLSDFLNSPGIFTPVDPSFESELTALHQSVYPAITPLDIDTIELEGIISSNLPGSPSLVPSELYRTSNSAFADGEFIAPTLTITPPSALERTGLKSSLATPESGQDRQYCDSRLSSLKIEYWTRIPISNEFAASVISHYLETYHAIFGCFDADLFLTDLVGRKLDFCSPFLLSALMSFACVGCLS